MLNALEYLRIKGVVHKDLKPENILYSKKDGKYKIADFGLSKK
jgi:serine/threonine protein kinase